MKKSMLRKLDIDPEAKNDFMSWGEFLANVAAGWFTDTDGFGELASVDHITHIRIKPSEAIRPNFQPPPGITHVCWNNI
jgi:hypothetical protein